MKHARVLSTVAATLLLAGAASAQTVKDDVAPTPAPPALQNAPAEKVAPDMKAGEKDAETHKSTTTGQAAPITLAPGRGQNIEQRTGIKNSYDTGAKTKTDADVKSSTDANGNPD